MMIDDVIPYSLPTSSSSSSPTSVSGGTPNAAQNGGTLSPNLANWPYIVAILVLVLVVAILVALLIRAKKPKGQ
jgi:hypothetical protein